MNKHFRVSGSIFQKLEELGVRVSAVLRRAGLPQGLFEQPRVLLTTEELFALWRAVGEVSTNPAIGLSIGTETKIEHFSPSALAALSTENLRRSHAPNGSLQAAHLSGRNPAGDGRRRVEHPVPLAVWPTKVEPPVLIECCFAWVLSIARHGTGTRLSPLRVEFVQPRSHLKTIERHFGCPVSVRSPTQRHRVSRRRRSAPVRYPQCRASGHACAAVRRRAEAADTATKTSPSASAEQIQQKLTGRRPTIEDIADALHISSRTLQRRLQDEGSSFQRVLEEARHQLARHYLNNSVLELNEAAYLLGYEDANSFVRAFRTWEGIPPARWREQQRAQAAS